MDCADDRRAAASADWLLTFLCRETVATSGAQTLGLVAVSGVVPPCHPCPCAIMSHHCRAFLVYSLSRYVLGIGSQASEWCCDHLERTRASLWCMCNPFSHAVCEPFVNRLAFLGAAALRVCQCSPLRVAGHRRQAHNHGRCPHCLDVQDESILLVEAPNFCRSMKGGLHAAYPASVLKCSNFFPLLKSTYLRH